MLATPLLLGPEQKAALAALRELATANPVDMVGLRERIKTPYGMARHMRQMRKQTVLIPFGFTATYSVETGHPIGTCRHLSMASPNRDRVPSPEGVWMIAEELGFIGDSVEEAQCTVWLEELKQGKAVNLVQPVTMVAESRA